MDLFLILKKIIFSNWVFSKPLKKKILIYDIPFLFEKFIEKKDYEVLNVRYETINFFVLISTIIKSGLKDIKNNYKKNYISFVKPKIIATSIDNNLAFFKLKKI